MKGISKYFAAMAVVTAGLLSSCGMESQFTDEGEGLLFISPLVKGDVPSSTRADVADSPSDPYENFTIWIHGEKGVMKRFKGVNNIPESFSLKVGSYKADAWAGDSVSASFDKKFYRAFYQDFEINKGVNRVSVVCKIANVVVCVNPESLNVCLKDMKITVSNSKGSLEFDSQNIAAAACGYFMMPNMDEDYLNYKIEGTTVDGSPYLKEGKIEGVQRAHKYTISLTEGDPLPTQGGALIKISIVDTPIIDENIYVFPAPAPRGLGFDINDQVVSETSDFLDTKVYMRGYHGLQSVVVKFSDNFNIVPSQMELNNSAIFQLGSRGISVERQEVLEDVDGNPVLVDEVYVNFTKPFLDALPKSPEEFKVTFEAVDGDGQVGTGEICFANTKEAVRFLPPVVPASAPDPASDPLAIGARKATLTGIIQDSEKATNYGIEYRKIGTAVWTKVYPSRTARTRVDQIPFTVTISGLEPGTVYEYRAFCDDFVSSEILQFSTEAVFQIPNASFEEWSTYRAKVIASYKDVILPSNAGDKETSFWGSGNEGAAAASKVLTDKSTDMLHGGTYSVQLKSQSAMGIIAAGNLFVGKYAETDGTNGVLALGREYNGSHPSKVRVYANYRPGAQVKVKSGNEKFVEIAEGGTDHGQIYVALTTEPVEIRTNPEKRKLFDPNDPCVVAYGQVTWTDNFGADGTLELLDIPFVYNDRAKTVQPKYLIIVASASKFGDYFSGSAGSVMYLDDFELIYE